MMDVDKNCAGCGKDVAVCECAPAVAPAGFDARCSKCESKNIKTLHISAGTLLNSSSTAKVDNQFVRSSEYDYFFKLTAKIEHLLKTCECGYSWRERIAQTKL